MKNHTFSLILLILIGSRGISSAQEREEPAKIDQIRRLLIAPFEYKGPAETAFIANATTVGLHDAIIHTTTMFRVEPSIVRGLIEDLQLPEPITPGVLSELGQELKQAPLGLLGSVEVRDGTIHIESRIYSIATAEALGPPLKFEKHIPPNNQVGPILMEWTKQQIAKLSEELSKESRQAIQTRLAPTDNVDAYAHYFMGRAALGRESKEECAAAIERFEKALALDPNFQLARAHLSEALMSYGAGAQLDGEPAQPSFTKAYEAAKVVVEASPNLAEGWRALALARLVGEKQDIKACHSAARMAAALSPKDADTYYYLWMCRGGGPDDPRVQTLLQMNPHHLAALNHIGSIYVAQGKYDLAERIFLRMLAADRRNPLTYRNLGTVSLKRGEIDDAIERFEIACTIEPNYVQGYSDLGAAHMSNGDLEKAGVCFKKMTEIDNDSFEGWNNLGLVYYKLDETVEAARALRRAVRLQDEAPQAHYFLGLLYERENRDSQALRSLRKSAEQGYSPAIKKLAELEKKDAP